MRAAVLFLLASAGVAAAAPETPPAVVGIVLDTSGSLKSDDLERSRLLARQLMAALPPRSEAALFTFDDQSRLVLARTSRIEEIDRALSEIRIAGRHTALHDALYDVSRYLREAPGGRKAIVLLTDGRDENSALELEDGLRVALEGRMPVYAVGVGRVDERALRRIAKLSGGDYLPAPAASGAALAGRIAAQPLSEPPLASPSAPPVATAPPAGVSRPAAKAAGPVAGSGVSRRTLLLVAAGVLLSLAVPGLLFSLRRARPEPASAQPTRRVPPSTRSTAPHRPPPADDYSPTLIARLDTSEEYVEQTVTMQERLVLAITRGVQAGEVFPLSAETTTSVGRSKANDIVVQDVATSSQHCRIRYEDGHFVLHDLQSTNGTYVNDRRVSRHALTEGDVIRIGDTAITFRRDYFTK